MSRGHDEITAVSSMNKRHKLDLYETNEKITRLLTGRVNLNGRRVLECCCGPGAMAAVLRPLCERLTTNDLDPQHPADHHLHAATPYLYHLVQPDWTITNPPFSEAEDILPAAFAGSQIGVAFLLRLSYLEPVAARGQRTGRASWLQRHSHELSHLIIVNPRPRFRPGTKGTDSVTVAWMVWQHDHSGGTEVIFVQGWR
jgi:hypothetical protein